jgi:hypothetical protein
VVTLPPKCGQGPMQVWAHLPLGVGKVPGKCGHTYTQVWSMSQACVVTLTSKCGQGPKQVWSHLPPGVGKVPGKCGHTYPQVWSRSQASVVTLFAGVLEGGVSGDPGSRYNHKEHRGHRRVEFREPEFWTNPMARRFEMPAFG